MSAPYHHPHHDYHRVSASLPHNNNNNNNNRQWMHNSEHQTQSQHLSYYQPYHHISYAQDYQRGYDTQYYNARHHTRAYDHASTSSSGYDSSWQHSCYSSRYPEYQDEYHAAHSYNASYTQAAHNYAAAQPPHAASPPSNYDCNTAAADVKSIQRVPVAPKKMRQASVAAAAATAATAAQSRSSQHPHADFSPPYYHTQPYNYPPQVGPARNHFHQSRDHHSCTRASRYQPYNTTPQASGSDSCTSTHPSSFNHYTSALRLAAQMAFGQAQFMRSQPRPEYMIQANTPSQTLTEEEAKHRKLLVVLDLNGTLVFRAKSGNGRALDSVRAVPRPYLSCFLQYCLGLSSINTTIFADQVERAKEVEIAQRPHGSQFWANAPQQSRGPTTSVLEPHSKGQAEVVVWSSAQPYNVDSMVLASFDQAVRSRILRVWARDTLVPARFYQHKAESIKDLEVVWAELNAFANNLGSPGRILAEDRHQADQLRPDAILACTNLNDSTKQQQKAEKAKLQKENQPMSAALKAAKRAQELGPWSWENTVLVDDSVTKARLQPWNHLLIPEYDKVEAGRMKKFIRQELATCRFAIDEQSGSAELEYDSDLSLTQDKAASMSTTNNHVSCANKKPMPESRLDDVLLQTIGVLETLRYQSNVCAFIYSGGIQGYGQERSKVILTQEEYKERVEKVNTPEYWAHKGRQICDKLGIEVKAWAMGASSTSALV